MRKNTATFLVFTLLMLGSSAAFSQKKDIPAVYSKISYDNKGFYFEPGSCIRNRHESIRRKERGTYVEEA